MANWVDLADDELTARLVAHGATDAEARVLVRHRDDRVARGEIRRALAEEDE